MQDNIIYYMQIKLKTFTSTTKYKTKKKTQ